MELVLLMSNVSNYLEKLNQRYAAKAFDKNKKLSPEEFEFLLEVLRLCPSSFGLQLWKFLIIKDGEIREKLREMAWGQKQVTDSDFLVVFCVPKEFDFSMVERHINNQIKVRGITQEAADFYRNRFSGYLKDNIKSDVACWMQKQVYIALGYLIANAVQIGVDTCPIEGMDKTAFDTILNLEQKGLKTVVACAVGYRDQADPAAKLPKVRYSRDEVIEII